MKKTLSVLLSLIMIISVTAGIDFSAYATTGSDVVNYANGFIGYPYVLNTHGPNSFDCSGFVYYVYKHFGITLSTASSDYYNKPTNYGTKITSESSAQPGDVCVWSGHVGIYSGNGQVINALNPSRGVCKIKISEYINGSGTMNPYHFFIRINGISTTTTNTVKLTFNGNGGTSSANSVTINKNENMGAKIPTATNYGYVFEGWYTSSNGGNKYTNMTKVSSNINLYAHWSKIDNCISGLEIGRVYRIINKKSGLALQANGSGDGALVRQQPRSNSTKQLWRVGVAGGAILTNMGCGRCLDVSGGESNFSNGAKLNIYGYSDNSKNNRIFIPVSRGSGYYSIHPVHSGRALDIEGASTEAGAQLQQYYYTGNDQQLFKFEEYTDRRLTFCDNLSNNYLTSLESDKANSMYTSRDTSYLTVSTNKVSRMMTVKALKAGTSSKSMTWETTCNRSYNYDFGAADTSEKYLIFRARSNVNGTKMNFRWGFDSSDPIASVTLSNSWQVFCIRMPRTLNSGGNIHPWIDRACTIELDNISLVDNTSDYNIHIDDSKTEKVLSVNSNNGKIGDNIPMPKTTKTGYHFVGWYTRRVGGTKVNKYSPMDTNQFLYAHWEPHNYSITEVVSPTCTEKGYTTYTCQTCGYSYQGDYVNALGHSFGNNSATCSVCGIANPNYVAPQPSKPTKPTNPTIPTQPTVTITTTPTQPSAPAVTTPTEQAPAGAKKVNGEWVAKKQKNAKIKKLTKAKKSFKATWKKVSGVKGYQIQYSTSKKFTKKTTKSVTIKKNKTTSKTVKKLKAKKKYYVRIRTYKNVKLNGKTVKVYSSWSKAKTVKTK